MFLLFFRVKYLNTVYLLLLFTALIYVQMITIILHLFLAFNQTIINSTNFILSVRP